MDIKNFLASSQFSWFKILLGPVFGFIIWQIMPENSENPLVARCAFVAVWMGVWWLTEAVPLAVTSLIPLALFPLMGVMPAKTLASFYTNDIVFLFIGGFIIALAMERWNLHKRIALKIMKVLGGRLSLTLLGFMLATAFLSMWISNTAATMMMVPIASAVLSRYDKIFGEENNKKISIGILLGIAYSASIGGTATLVGTPPNMVFAQISEIQFPTSPGISFSQWMIMALPFSVSFLLVIWALLYYMNFRHIKVKSDKSAGSRDIFIKELLEMGRMKREELSVLIVFVLLALLWILRKPLQFGSFTVPGWSTFFSEPKFIGDGTVAIFMAIILFILPASEPKEKIMNWEWAKKLPWRIVLLFGGGFALAGAIKDSGLAAWIGNQLIGLGSLAPSTLTASICTMMTFLTELTSNTATTQMLLPILATLGVTIGRNPYFLMIPATLSASCAFMMPVATPPNAIIFGTGRIRIVDMAKTGIILNLIGVLLITLLIHLYASVVIPGEINILPDWSIG